MRIGLFHPTYWPEVLRGSERIVHDLAVALAGRGHEVTIVTSHPGRTSVAVEDGVRVVRRRRPPRPPGAGRYEHHLQNAPNAWWELRRRSFDVVHTFFPVDSWVAVAARRRGGAPVVATFHGLPDRRYLVARRRRLETMEAVARGADECTVLSEAAARPFAAYLRRRPVVLPPGVVSSDFASERTPAEPPVLLCAAALGDPRKRGALLLDAFARVRDRVPGARLELIGGRDPFLSEGEPPLGAGARRLEPSADPRELADRLASASASVLPAVDEAFGLVLVESLAAGTPVVAARSGAGEEIVTGDQIGSLFAADDSADLARAILAAFELASDPRTRERCRARAREFEWSALVERYEAVYESVLEKGSARA